MSRPVRIVTMCRQGLVRSVALADVLKLHFRPVDVIPLGHFGNTRETIEMLSAWADWIVVMEERYLQHVPQQYASKALVCEVGPDVNTHHGSKTRWLIDLVWRWAREHQGQLGIEEHQERV